METASDEGSGVGGMGNVMESVGTMRCKFTAEIRSEYELKRIHTVTIRIEEEL